MNQITKNIFVGDWNDSIDQHQLIKNNIKYIIGINNRFKTPNNFELYTKLNIKYMHINEYDIETTDIKKHFYKTNTFIHRAITQNKNILIHCTLGVSRSVTILIAYLLWIYYLCDKEKNAFGITQSEISIYKKKYRLNDIINYIRTHRFQINPNRGFITQLKKYENELIVLKCQ